MRCKLHAIVGVQKVGKTHRAVVNDGSLFANSILDEVTWLALKTGLFIDGVDQAFENSDLLHADSVLLQEVSLFTTKALVIQRGVQLVFHTMVQWLKGETSLLRRISVHQDVSPTAFLAEHLVDFQGFNVDELAIGGLGSRTDVIAASVGLVRPFIDIVCTLIFVVVEEALAFSIHLVIDVSIDALVTLSCAQVPFTFVIFVDQKAFPGNVRLVAVQAFNAMSFPIDEFTKLWNLDHWIVHVSRFTGNWCLEGILLGIDKRKFQGVFTASTHILVIFKAVILHF